MSLQFLHHKPVLVNTDEGFVWVNVPVEVTRDTTGKIISERFIERTASPVISAEYRKVEK